MFIYLFWPLSCWRLCWYIWSSSTNPSYLWETHKNTEQRYLSGVYQTMCFTAGWYFHWRVPNTQICFIHASGILGPGHRNALEGFTYVTLPWWLRWGRICLQCWRPGFNLWVGTIPWRSSWQLTPIFLPGESPWIQEPGGLCTAHGVAEIRTQLSTAQHVTRTFS